MTYEQTVKMIVEEMEYLSVNSSPGHSYLLNSLYETVAQSIAKKLDGGWEINPNSAKDESEGVTYLILKEEDSIPLVGTYGDNYGHFATNNEMINIKDLYAIKEFEYPEASPPQTTGE